jgi:hypothetical protein
MVSGVMSLLALLIKSLVAESASLNLELLTMDIIYPHKSYYYSLDENVAKDHT